MARRAKNQNAQVVTQERSNVDPVGAAGTNRGKKHSTRAKTQTRDRTAADGNHRPNYQETGCRQEKNRRQTRADHRHTTNKGTTRAQECRRVAHESPPHNVPRGEGQQTQQYNCHAAGRNGEVRSFRTSQYQITVQQGLMRRLQTADADRQGRKSECTRRRHREDPVSMRTQPREDAGYHHRSPEETSAKGRAAGKARDSTEGRGGKQ